MGEQYMGGMGQYKVGETGEKYKAVTYMYSRPRLICEVPEWSCVPDSATESSPADETEISIEYAHRSSCFSEHLYL